MDARNWARLIALVLSLPLLPVVSELSAMLFPYPDEPQRVSVVQAPNSAAVGAPPIDDRGLREHLKFDFGWVVPSFELGSTFELPQMLQPDQQISLASCSEAVCEFELAADEVLVLTAARFAGPAGGRIHYILTMDHSGSLGSDDPEGIERSQIAAASLIVHLLGTGDRIVILRTDGAESSVIGEGTEGAESFDSRADPDSIAAGIDTHVTVAADGRVTIKLPSTGQARNAEAVKTTIIRSDRAAPGQEANVLVYFLGRDEQPMPGGVGAAAHGGTSGAAADGAGVGWQEFTHRSTAIMYKGALITISLLRGLFVSISWVVSFLWLDAATYRLIRGLPQPQRGRARREVAGLLKISRFGGLAGFATWTVRDVAELAFAP